ncbi:MAG TPA: hypothetical protein VHS31_18730 [Tepidisphaeraceae bacterium]|jgi:hypothetical protein|nr:hypothetical protein [Tepidisphaeraceae bacterium]
MMRVTDAAAKYGCMGLSDLFRPESGEEIFMGIDSFADVEQFRMLSKQIDADARIGELFSEIQEVIDLKQIVRWEAARVD